MDDLPGLEPRAMWHSFLTLSAIPRRPGAEEAAANFVAEEGRVNGCTVERDAAGNVLLRQRATPGQEDRPGLALQAHLDMVCEKDARSAHDFARDAIAVWRDGDDLRARGTSLGADNGIGVAAALAVLSERDLRHGPLEILFTVDEERGLNGARAVSPGWLKAKKLVNLDSQAEGVLIVGCAGALDTVAVREVSLELPPAGLAALRISVDGLAGGHSGIDIARGRGNAIRILSQVLLALGEDGPLRLASIEGGTKRNAIPREATAVVCVDPARAQRLREQVSRQEAAFREALGTLEPALALKVEEAAPVKVMAPAQAEAVLALLLAAPHGVEEWSPTISGLVQTSTNLARVETRPREVAVSFLTRSALDTSKAALSARIASLGQFAGFEVSHGGAYPGWKPDPASRLARLVEEVYADLFEKRMTVAGVHAGLECSLLGHKHPGLEMVSFGPSMWDVHTPSERASIASAARFYELLLAVVKRVARGD